MNDTEILKHKLRAILLLMKAFFKDSSVFYIEGSSEIVDSGAYEWLPLDRNQKIDQKVICNQYELILAETIHLKVDSEILTAFNESGERVLSFLRQDSMVWQNTTSKVYNEVVKELDSQLKLSERL